jgi:glycosyltransferase involved in cell wall biosynthesis
MNKKINYSETPRVLHLVPGFQFGGIESLLMSMYRGLDKQKIQFDFMVDTLDTLPEFDEIRKAGGRVFQMGRYLDSPINYQRKLNKILREHSQDYIALHSHTVIRALPVLWAAKRYNIHQRILHSHTDNLDGSRSAPIAPFIAKITTLLATDYLACSKKAGQLFFKDKNYKVFSNAIRTQHFLFNETDREEIRKHLGVDTDALIVGHTGRFTYEKNHEFLIEVFANLHEMRSDARLILVGSGPLESDIQALATKLGLNEVVFFVGLQSDVAPYLSAMDVFFLPSYFEGFCISLLEAQANGLPSLASNVIPEEVKLTSSIVTCNSSANARVYATSLLKLYEQGRADSSINISQIQQAGYDSDLQQNNILAMYKKI